MSEPRALDFKDHFSKQAEAYAKYRPTYPAELFLFLAEISYKHERAWDCATGSGQSAIALAAHFREVIATDASPKQLQHAVPHERVIYQVGSAEGSGLASDSCDLITVAQALHWFNFASFYEECRRIGRTGAVLAVWNYNLLSITPEIDAVINHLYTEVVGRFWPPERKHIESDYANIPFSFDKISAPHFAMYSEWNLRDLLGYLNTWSATQKYMAENSANPISKIEDELWSAWGDEFTTRPVTWPLNVIVGRIK